LNPTPVNAQSIALAAELLRQDKLVVIPTETVYGLGGDASNPAAVRKIFAAKNRPVDHPLIVHLAYPKQMADWACDVPNQARRLAAQFWPGPLTLILNKKNSVPLEVTGGQSTVALRVPSHPAALWLLREFGGGIAAPSANRFGRISPTEARHVIADLGDAVACVLDGGPCMVGVESTILDLSGNRPVLLRPGRILRSELEAFLQTDIAVKTAHTIRAPGMMAVHYAPNTTAYLCPSDTLLENAREQAAQGRRLGLLVFERHDADWPDHPTIALPCKPETYEPELYRALRQLDQAVCDLILIEQPPQDEAWQAVNDRLAKATVQGE